MPTSLSKLFDNSSEIYNKKCKDKNCKSECEFKGLKNYKYYFDWKECRKIQLKPTKGLIEKFPNTYIFYNNDINKLTLLVKKGGYPYKYMDSWKRFNETTLSNKKVFTVNYI